MKTYSTTITKKDFVAELKKHQEADAFIQGSYGKGFTGKFKACAVGCSLESIARVKKLDIDYADHSAYEEHLGIPQWLAHVEDKIFEGVSKKRTKTWPVEFAQAVPVGVDLEPVKRKFLIVVLKHSLKSFDNKAHPRVTKAIKDVIGLWKNGGTAEQFQQARSAAYAAAAYAATYAAAAAYAATYAADAAAYAAADAADAAASRTKTMEHFADELLKLLKATKPKKRRK